MTPLSNSRGNPESGAPPYYLQYREFWQHNLQTLLEMTDSLEKAVLNLENKYRDFDAQYHDIIGRLDAIAAIHSGYNCLLGRNYLLKLKALLRHYRKRYTQEGINFNIISFLQARIKETLEESFRDFPKMHHAAGKQRRGPEKTAAHKPQREPRYRWQTFNRNGSWCIVSCRGAEIYSSEDAVFTEGHDPVHFCVRSPEGDIPLHDLFSGESPPARSRFNYVIVITGEGWTAAFAADLPGKKITAGRDIFYQHLKPVKKTAFVSGKIRLFGEYHYLIKPSALY